MSAENYELGPNGCTRFDCYGDGNYAAPGKGHLPDCFHPLNVLFNDNDRNKDA